ncbi:VOC family protein [Streptomyces sp. NPDC049881]|uniref:VOC family protein n=1 Tax=unclassified Streptomyces TaxID=2593676 RepID=UPI00344A2A11
MADIREGLPCWADVTLPDVEEGKRFYGQLFGWTFDRAADEYGGYAQAWAGGAAAAALAPQLPGQGAVAPPAWNLYLASEDVPATADRVRAAGGDVLVEPMLIGDFGSMCVGRDPGGVVFGVWEPGTHRGFGARGEPGTYAWAEVYTRDGAAADAFFSSVFPYETVAVEGPPAVDYALWQLDGGPCLGRYRFPPDAPGDIAPHVEVFFAVGDCDAAVATARGLGGRLIDGPMDSPYGRYAAVADSQGANFMVIDLETTTAA